MTILLVVACSEAPMDPLSTLRPANAERANDVACTGCGIERVTVHISEIDFLPEGSVELPTDFPWGRFSCESGQMGRISASTAVRDGESPAADAFQGRLTMPGFQQSGDFGPFLIEGSLSVSGSPTVIGLFVTDWSPTARTCSITDGVMRIALDVQGGAVISGMMPDGEQFSGAAAMWLKGHVDVAPDLSVIATAFTLRFLDLDDPRALEVTPADETRAAGSSHSLFASVSDFWFEPRPVPGASVVFDIEGATSERLACATNSAGQCSVTYTGPAAGGVDQIAAFVDIDGDGAPGFGEPVSSSQVRWLVPNEPPTIAHGGPYQGIEGTALQFNASGSDPDDDPITYRFDFGDGSTPLETSDPRPLHTYAENGNFTVTMAARDAHGAENGVVSTTVSIANAPPVLGPIAGPAHPLALGVPAHVSASYTDRGALDTHVAIVDWGDGTIANGDVSGGNVSASHTYPAPGVYTVRVQVRDDDGAFSADNVFQYVVLYDPLGGFVTGGGWIESPAGALAADPGVSGKATFGFVARYRKGAETPDGNTQFEFRTAALNFRSAGYQWLVVAGARAMFKGDGTINGGGRYGFQLTAIDGQLRGDGIDRFRIKIWDAATGALVYDNQPGSGDDADDATALGGGSVVIHKP